MICLYWVRVDDWRKDSSRTIKVSAENRREAYDKAVLHLKDGEYVVSVD